MTSFRQIEANRRNALRSTGPKTFEGKLRSRQNAVRHGLTAETVIEGLEDTEDYRAFEATIISDYDAQTAVERELVLRLASLLWRMRRIISIETDLLRIQAEILRDRRSNLADASCAGEKSEPIEGLLLESCFDREEQPPAQPGPSKQPQRHNDASSRLLTYCFLRVENFDNRAFERLARYNAVLWRQTAQTLFLLQSTRRY